MSFVAILASAYYFNKIQESKVYSLIEKPFHRDTYIDSYDFVKPFINVPNIENDTISELDSYANETDERDDSKIFLFDEVFQIIVTNSKSDSAKVVIWNGSLTDAEDKKIKIKASKMGDEYPELSIPMIFTQNKFTKKYWDAHNLQNILINDDLMMERCGDKDWEALRIPSPSGKLKTITRVLNTNDSCIKEKGGKIRMIQIAKYKEIFKTIPTIPWILSAHQFVKAHEGKTSYLLLSNETASDFCYNRNIFVQKLENGNSVLSAINTPPRLDKPWDRAIKAQEFIKHILKTYGNSPPQNADSFAPDDITVLKLVLDALEKAITDRPASYFIPYDQKEIKNIPGFKSVVFATKKN